MGPRVYKVPELIELLPRLEEILTEMDVVRGRLQVIKKKMDVLEMIHGPQILQATGPDRTEYGQCLEAVDRERKEFEAIAAKITEIGGVIKGIDQGLVDFYGVIDGHLIWLCWQRGEKEVAYYHHLDEGFAGRQPIPVSHRDE